MAATAGCLGYTVTKEDEVDERKQKVRRLERTAQSRKERIDTLQKTVTAKDERISQLESTIKQKEQRISQLESTIKQKEQRIQQLESSSSSAKTRISNLESQVARLKREKVSELYTIAHTYHKDGQSWFSTAQSSESNGNYGIAEGQYAVANGRYLSAEDAASRAAKLAGTIGETTAKNTIDEAASAFDLYAKAMIAYANENLFRSKGDTSRADDYESDGNTDLSNAQSNTVAKPATVDSELGL